MMPNTYRRLHPGVIPKEYVDICIRFQYILLICALIEGIAIGILIGSTFL